MTHMAGVCLVPGLAAPPGLLLLLPPVSEGEEDHQQEDAEEDEDEGGHAHHQQVQVRLVEVGDGLRDEDGGILRGDSPLTLCYTGETARTSPRITMLGNLSILSQRVIEHRALLPSTVQPEISLRYFLLNRLMSSIKITNHHH